mmetsp:Transcript_37670/g.58596  ORF Transcript_37670/g.58596 Transcript_37670/m.58596 type:complete len:91 (+) Transcript_37670:236-508(+)
MCSQQKLLQYDLVMKQQFKRDGGEKTRRKKANQTNNNNNNNKKRLGEQQGGGKKKTTTTTRDGHSHQAHHTEGADRPQKSLLEGPGLGFC